jgi:uncharacterized small protein (DUF1192 family)
MQLYDIDESKGYPDPVIVPDDLGDYYLATEVDEQIAALTATIKAQAEYNTLELARIAQLQEKVEALQAELKMERARNKVCGMVVRENEAQHYRINELEHINQWQQKQCLCGADVLQAEANKNMQEICRLRGQVAKLRSKIIRITNNNKCYAVWA